MSNIQSILKQIAMIVKKEMNTEYQLFLFGSRASGGHDSKADIDIGISADKPVEAKTWLTSKKSLNKFRPF